MGLVSGEIDGKTEYVALTDILGAEDAFGDMDFKIAGTEEFVTALQLDTKLDGIPASVLGAALNQARDARLTLLEVMAEAIDGPDEMAPNAPRVITVRIPVDKIGEVIGPKGKMINSIQDETGADITIDDDGTIYIGAVDGPSAEAARTMVNSIANPTMPEVGERYLGTVVKTTTFGAFISLLPGKDGLLHISEIKKIVGKPRIDSVDDVLPSVQKVRVEIKEVDDRGKLSLTAVKDEDEAATRRGRRLEHRFEQPTWHPHAPPGPGRKRREAHCPARWTPGGHRGRAHRALGLFRRVGRCRAHATRPPAQAGASTTSSTCSSRAPTSAVRSISRRPSTALGGEMNAFTSKEFTCFYARVLDADLPIAIDVITDMVLSSTITGPDFDSERGVILEEIAMHDDDPGDVVHDTFAASVFGDTPLGRPILGSVESIESISRRTPFSRLLPSAGTAPRTWWSRRPATSTMQQWCGWSRRHSRRGSATDRRGRRDALLRSAASVVPSRVRAGVAKPSGSFPEP